MNETIEKFLEENHIKNSGVFKVHGKTIEDIVREAYLAGAAAKEAEVRGNAARHMGKSEEVDRVLLDII